MLFDIIVRINLYLYKDIFKQGYRIMFYVCRYKENYIDIQRITRSNVLKCFLNIILAFRY